MRRREFITLVSGAAASRSFAARAQQAKPIVRISYLSILGGAGEDAFRQGLRDFGYVEGQNLLVEWRRADETAGQLDGFVAELVARKVDVIVTVGSQATRAALQQTKTIPIVALSTNPVGLGFVASLAKPGGNVTGVSLLGPEVAAKRLQLLKQSIPSIARIAVLWNPDDPAVHFSLEETQVAAATLALSLQILEARNADAIESSLLAASNEGAEAVVLLPTPLFAKNAAQIANLAMQRRLPTLFYSVEAVRSGALMAYGADLLATIRRQAYFVDRILKGAKPVDLPVELPTKFELAVNLKTAKVLGITIPDRLLATADEVIE